MVSKGGVHLCKSGVFGVSLQRCFPKSGIFPMDVGFRDNRNRGLGTINFFHCPSPHFALSEQVCFLRLKPKKQNQILTPLKHVLTTVEHVLTHRSIRPKTQNPFLLAKNVPTPNSFLSKSPFCSFFPNLPASIVEVLDFSCLKTFFFTRNARALISGTRNATAHSHCRVACQNICKLLRVGKHKHV